MLDKHIRLLLKIYGASTASYAENKCSTYHRYASALFSASSLYLYRLFSKGFFREYTVHLLRRIIKSVHPCTLLMANFGFAEISLLVEPVASVPLLKMLNVQKVRLRFIFARALKFQNGHGCSWFHAPPNLPCKLDVEQCTRKYTVQQAIFKG